MDYSFENVMREYMDYSDSDTLHSIAEASDNQNQMLVALTSKLYDLIVEKADKVDFSTISRSRGDIAKIEKYDQLTECINVMRNIVTAYKENTYPLDVITTAIENLKSRSNMFKKAFVINSPVPVMAYNNIGLAIVYSVSFLISTCIEYIKEPGAETFMMALDTIAYNKTDSNLLFNSLESFNEACKSGEFDKSMQVVMNQTKIKRESAEVEVKPDNPFLSPEQIENDNVIVHDNDDQCCGSKEVQSESITGLAIAASIPTIGFVISRAIAFIAKWFVPTMRNLSYFWYSSKQKVSDYWAVQADLLEMNAYQLQYNSTFDVDDKKRIIDKQLKVAAKWKARSNKWSVDYTVTKKNAEKMASSEAKKFVVSDLNYNGNDETYDTKSSVLF